MKKKYLPLYYKWMKKGNMPHFGLCRSLGDDDAMLKEIFAPKNVDTYTFWAATDNWFNELSVFTPLRQTILLLMAAMNDEL